MKEEALKLADELQGLCEYSYVEIPDYQAMQYVDMIRKLVAELDKQTSRFEKILVKSTNCIVE